VRLYAPGLDPRQPYPLIGYEQMQGMVRSPKHAFVVYWLGQQVQGVFVLSTAGVVFEPLNRAERLGDAFTAYQQVLAARFDAGAKEQFRRLMLELYQILIQPIAAHLAKLGVDQITFMPHHKLHLLPLHALHDSHEYVLDRHTVSYSPSFSLLQMCAEHRAQGEVTHRLLLVDNPDDSLQYAHIEAQQVSQLFDEPQLLAGHQAHRDAIRERLEGSSYIHFSCHGGFDADCPERIGLRIAPTAEHSGYLAREEILTAFRVASGSTVVLSACDSGRALLSETDEFIGLPSAFLVAGASAIVGSLWAVNDLSTALLMGRFYRYHLRGDEETGDGPMAPAQALQRAQSWLRKATADEMKLAEHYQRLVERWGLPAALRQSRYFQRNPNAIPFEHPYFWAAFVFTGV
jgi:CHAT domain-containing protein